MADIMHFIKEKMASFPNKNNTVQMKLNIMKELYALFLSQEGREYLTREDRLRNTLERKVIEFMENVDSQNDLQFISQSQVVLTVVANINLGKNL